MSKLLTIGLLILLTGCANYSSDFQHIEVLLQQQKPQEALLELEQHPVSGKDALLYFLNKAMLERMNGLYVESNASFEQAKEIIESLKGVSIQEQVGSLAINEGTKSYEGEPYEQMAIHIYEAFNYIALGQLDDARVEALQVDLRLQALAQQEQ